MIKKEDEIQDCDVCGSHETSLIFNTKTNLWAVVCGVCRSYVSCHPGTKEAMGRLASPHTRRLRVRLHEVADPLYKDGLITRSYLYVLMSAAVNREGAHASDMTDEELLLAIAFFESYRDEKVEALIRRKAKKEARRAKRYGNKEDE